MPCPKRQPHSLCPIGAWKWHPYNLRPESNGLVSQWLVWQNICHTVHCFYDKFPIQASWRTLPWRLWWHRQAHVLRKLPPCRRECVPERWPAPRSGHAVGGRLFRSRGRSWRDSLFCILSLGLLERVHRGSRYSNLTGTSRWCHRGSRGCGNRPYRYSVRLCGSLGCSGSSRGQSCLRWRGFPVRSVLSSPHWIVRVLWFQCRIS